MPNLNGAFAGANVGLFVALALLIIGGGGLLLGPGSGIIDGVRAELSVRADQLDDWTREQASFSAAGDVERETWARQWAELKGRVRPVADNPALVARVADQLHAPSVRRFQVDTLTPPRLVDDEAESAWIVSEPNSGTEISIEEVPLRVSFGASYADALDILGRLETGLLPARVESLDMKRDRPGVWLRIDLTYFVRAEEGTS